MDSSSTGEDIEIDGFVDLGQYLVERSKDTSLPLGNASVVFERKDGGNGHVTVMVAGKPRNGKSTVLNNIFGVRLEARPSVKPVTRSVCITDATRNKVAFRVIDTPGLGSLEISTEKTLEEMRQVTAGKRFTLIYCFSVSPDSLLDETDKALINSLHAGLGKDIWQNCIVLLTFSDLALEEFSSSEAYVEHMQSHAREFQLLLNSLCEDLPPVSTIFDCGAQNKHTVCSKIIAVPVTKRTKHSDKILPGILTRDQDWTCVVMNQIMKISECEY